ncbi:MAG: class I SAM-dependent methyltransferase [Steroidobacteraceae bacterium]
MSSTLPDPPVPDWVNMQLPDSWADQLKLWRPWDLLKLLRRVMSKRQRVQLPEGMPGRELLPKYVLQEFHHLPNGNYSKQLTHGYVTGFDRMMLGTMRSARNHLAHNLRRCQSVLDVGTAGGRTAAALKAQGIREVWGLDPSPYLLQHAARRCSGVNFVQGVAEQTPFTDARFDGVVACFVLHELPPKQVQAALHEFARITQPGALLAICEPSAEQLDRNMWRLLRRHGWRGLYFSWLAHAVHEPFIRAWHRLDVKRALHEAGFECLSDEEHFPSRMVLARRS